MILKQPNGIRAPFQFKRAPWWSIAANQKKKKKKKNKNDNKKIEKMKKIIMQRQTPQNYHGL